MRYERDVISGKVVELPDLPLTPEQLAERAAAPNRAIDAQIAALEGAPLFLSRPVREFTLGQILYNHLKAVYDIDNPMLATDEQEAQGISDLTDSLSTYYNAGFKKMKALDDQIRALRAQRT